MSLILSDIIPVKLFGIYATAGIVTTLGLLLMTLPGAEERWPVAPREKRDSMFKDLSGIANFCCRFPVSIVLVIMALMVACGWGLQWMKTSVNVRSLFAPESKILADYAWYEQHIGPMTPVELVVHFPAGDPLSPLQQLEVVDELQWHMDRIAGLDGTMSAATFMPSIPRSPVERSAVNLTLEKNIGKFDQVNYYRQKETDNSWRISGRVAALGRVDYGEFLDEIQSEIDPRLWAFHYIREINRTFADQNRRELGKKKVLLVGAPLESVLTQLAAGDDDAQAGSLPPPARAEVFLDQLLFLMEEEGFKAENMTAVGAADLPADLSEYDAVILVDAPQANVDALAKGNAAIVDARRRRLDEGQKDPRAVTATYTGVMPLAYEVQRVLLQDLIKSFLSAAALVTLVMIVLQRSAFAGTVAMLPNIFPMVVLFGITSWRGMAIDIGTVMTASVALGIAVDDTLHFLTWFNREHSDTGDNKAAVKLAFRHCAKAMLQTTLICSLGLVIYSFSSFMPTRRFAWMMVTLLMAAVAGDLILLPALLASPLGRWFPQRKLMGDPMAKLPQPAPVETAPAANPAR